MKHLLTTAELSGLLKIQTHTIFMRECLVISLTQNVKVGNRLHCPMHAIEALLEQHVFNK